MDDKPEIEVQRNNPLHGVKLADLLDELLEHYSWEDLADAINLNCFKSNPSVKSSLKFLRKTPWAREKVENFYLYKYKRLPRPNDEQYEISPRERIIPLDQEPKEPNNSPPPNVWDNWKKNSDDSEE